MAVRNWSGADLLERDTTQAFAAKKAAGVLLESPQNHSGQAARSNRVDERNASPSRTTDDDGGAGAGVATGAAGMSRGRSAPILRPAFVMSTRAFDVCEGRSASSALTLNFLRGGDWSSRFFRFRPFFGSGFIGSGSSSCVE